MKNKKIDIHFKDTQGYWHYIYSTCFYSSCRDAKKAALELFESIVNKKNKYDTQYRAKCQLYLNHPEKIKAFFDKRSN